MCLRRRAETGGPAHGLLVLANKRMDVLSIDSCYSVKALTVA